MSRVITVTQVHFQACKWLAICWLSYANVPCGVLTSRGEHNGCVVTRWGWNKVKTPGCIFLNERSWKTFSAQIITSSDFQLLVFFVWNSWWIVCEEQTFIRRQSINERKPLLDATWDSCWREKQAASSTKLLLQSTLFTGSVAARPCPPLLQPAGASRVFITTAPCLINGTANVTSYRKTLCAGGWGGGQLRRSSVWQSLQSAAGQREEKRLCNWYLFR